MNRKTIGALGAALTLAATTATTGPAAAAGSFTVTNPSCGVLEVSNDTTQTLTIETDGGHYQQVPANDGGSWSKVPSGRYVWRTVDANDNFVGHGSVTVKACSGLAKRPIDGDQNGDGVADVLGVRSDSGKLFYYRMTPSGLATGIEAGHGWLSTNWMQQVNEIDGVSSGNKLVSRRDDGTVWMYDNAGPGKFYNGHQIGRGFQGYSNLAVVHLNNGLGTGWHMLLASQGDTLYSWNLDSQGLTGKTTLLTGYTGTTQTIALRDFDGDQWADLMAVGEDGSLTALKFRWNGDMAASQVGSGWTVMSAIYSPGDMTGDSMPDLLARRKDDADLYRYTNTVSSTGVHRWSQPVKIGNNWNIIKLFA